MGGGTEAEPGLARQCQGEQSPENLRLTVNTKGRWAQGRILFFPKLIAQGQGLRAMWGKVDRWTESTGLLCLSVGGHQFVYRPGLDGRIKTTDR